jgi:hypothetical protein
MRNCLVRNIVPRRRREDVLPLPVMNFEPIDTHQSAYRPREGVVTNGQEKPTANASNILPLPKMTFTL